MTPPRDERGRFATDWLRAAMTRGRREERRRTDAALGFAVRDPQTPSTDPTWADVATAAAGGETPARQPLPAGSFDGGARRSMPDPPPDANSVIRAMAAGAMGRRATHPALNGR